MLIAYSIMAEFKEHARMGECKNPIGNIKSGDKI